MMRPSILASLVAALALVTLPVLADVGPRAPCEKGTHHEYRYGHHCVPDGSHLEVTPEGGTKVVPDKVDPNATPSATPSAAPPATPPNVPPPERGCACSVSDERTAAAGMLAAAAAAAVLLRRRRSR